MNEMVWPQGYDRRVLARVESTSSEAQRIASELSGPTWILALEQTAGRGRRGRSWAFPKGNFAATLVMPAQGALEHMALRSFVAALALFETCVTLTGRPEAFALKWPNDVLLNGGKLAGILLESAGAVGRAPSHIAIGIGVNLIEAPSQDQVEEGALRPVSLLSETGAEISPDVFLDHLAVAFAAWEQQIVTYGFDPIRTAWLARAARLGEVIKARSMRDEWVGTFETVDNAGNLVLKTSKGPVAIPAADVFF